MDSVVLGVYAILPGWNLVDFSHICIIWLFASNVVYNKSHKLKYWLFCDIIYAIVILKNMSNFERWGYVIIFIISHEGCRESWQNLVKPCKIKMSTIKVF